MSLGLPRPGAQYSQGDEANARGLIEAADAQNMKIRQDVNISKRRLILQSPDGNLWSVEVSNAGALSTVAI